jgi:hypothetical protein
MVQFSKHVSESRIDRRRESSHGIAPRSSRALDEESLRALGVRFSQATEVAARLSDLVHRRSNEYLGRGPDFANLSELGQRSIAAQTR